MLQGAATVLPAVSMLLLTTAVLLAMWWAVIKRAWALPCRLPSDSSVITGTHFRFARDMLTLFRHLTGAEAASRRQQRELSANRRLTVAAISTLALDQILQQVYEQIRQFSSLDVFCVALSARDSDDVRMELIVEDGHIQPGFAIKADDNVNPAVRVIRSQQPLRINDMEADPDRLLATPQLKTESKIRAWLGLPLIVQGRVIGMISLGSYHPNAFTVNDEQLLAPIATQAAVAIENARLYREAKRRLEEASIRRSSRLGFFSVG